MKSFAFFKALKTGGIGINRRIYMIGIVILNYNTPNDVIECVKSIRDTTIADYKIYVVDNMSTDDSFVVLSKEFKGDNKVVVMQSDYNGGYSYGNNFGIKEAVSDGCDYILISNPDIVYYDKCIDVMLDTLNSDERIGVVGPSTPSLDQAESQLLRKVYTPKIYFHTKKPFRIMTKFKKSLRSEYPYPKETDKPFLFFGMVRGCCFMMRTDVFEKIGFFDDNVFLYSEEWILAKKLSDLGLYCAYEPRAKALHKEATSTKKVGGSGFQSFHLYLSAYYYLKYYSGCGKFFLWVTKTQNRLNYGLKALSDKSYRKFKKRFKAAQKALHIGRGKKICVDHVE